MAELVHRFWKLSLQLVSRYSVWLQAAAVSFSGEGANGNMYAAVAAMTDAHSFTPLILVFYSKIIVPQIIRCSPGFTQFDQLTIALEDTATSLSGSAVQLRAILVKRLVDLCTGSLENAKLVPRQYRHTKRSPPTTPSAYVDAMLIPLRAFFATHSRALSEFEQNMLAKMTLETITIKYVNNLYINIFIYINMYIYIYIYIYTFVCLTLVSFSYIQ